MLKASDGAGVELRPDLGDKADVIPKMLLFASFDDDSGGDMPKSSGIESHCSRSRSLIERPFAVANTELDVSLRRS